jgi:hypothetical protein
MQWRTHMILRGPARYQMSKTLEGRVVRAPHLPSLGGDERASRVRVQRGATRLVDDEGRRATAVEVEDGGVQRMVPNALREILFRVDCGNLHHA